MSELKPCACGGDAMVNHKKSLYDPTFRRYSITCLKCDNKTVEFGDKETAVKAWNEKARNRQTLLQSVLRQCREERQYHDSHYLGDVQPIEMMQEQFTAEEFRGYLKGNIIKYASRLGKKDDPKKEADKIINYANWLHEHTYKGKITVGK